MAYGYIYKIPFPNGKCYIGLTTNLNKRWKEHNKDAKAGNTRHLFNALRKYNMVDTFLMIVIDTAETKKELCEKEIAHIEINNSHYKRGYGYNMTDGGEGKTGYEYTEEDRQKQSEARKKYFEDPEARRKTSEAQKIRYEDPEERRKNSEAQKKYNKDNPEKGKKHSEVMKKHYESTEARQKQSEAIKKRFEDPKERQKISEARKKYFEDPEARRKNSEGRKQYYKDISNARRKLSDGKGKNKPFDIFKKDGTYIKSFNYQFEAMEYLQKTYDIKTQIKIGEVLQGKRNSSHGFIFKYKE